MWRLLTGWWMWLAVLGSTVALPTLRAEQSAIASVIAHTVGSSIQGRHAEPVEERSDTAEVAADDENDDEEDSSEGTNDDTCTVASRALPIPTCDATKARSAYPARERARHGHADCPEHPPRT